MEILGFHSGSPNGPILTNILAVSDIEIRVMLEGGAEECYSLCQETEDCHSWAFYNKTKDAKGHEIQDLCYLDSRSDLRGQSLMPVPEGGDRDSPPAGMKTETKGAAAKKTQKKRPTKKSKPGNQATKRATEKPTPSIRTTTTATTTTASGDAATTLKMQDSTNLVADKEPVKKNSNKRRKTVPKRKKPLLESDDEDTVLVINADPEFKTEAKIDENTE